MKLRILWLLLVYVLRVNADDSIRTYVGHTSFVWSVFVSNNYLFSGSSDNTIKQWDITTGSLIRNYTGHIDGVPSIFVVSTNLFSGSRDKTILQWDIN